MCKITLREIKSHIFLGGYTDITTWTYQQLLDFQSKHEYTVEGISYYRGRPSGCVISVNDTDDLYAVTECNAILWGLLG